MKRRVGKTIERISEHHFLEKKNHKANELYLEGPEKEDSNY